jgi:hypothetical protein
MTQQDIIETENEVTGVQYHPTIEHLFATSDGAGRVLLRDARMAFGPLVNRTDGGIVQRVGISLTSPPDCTISQSLIFLVQYKNNQEGISAPM